MQGDLQATVCGRQDNVHGNGCPRWCDAAHLSMSGGDRGSPWPVPTEAPGSNSLDWDALREVYVRLAEPVTVLGQVGEHAKPDWPQSFVDGLARETPHGLVRSELTAATAGLYDHGADLATAENGVRALLRLMGEDPERDGIRDTPKRVVKAYLEMASRPGDPAELLSRVFGDVGQSSEMICVPGIRFVSLCEHHLLPFTGTAAVAYIPRPGGSVVGLSKIPRLVHHWAMRPQVQERLTRQIADSLEEGLTEVEHPDNPQRKRHLPPLGVAVRIDSTHSCMSLRGVKADAASMVTTDLRGRFKDGAARAEFLSEAQR